MEYTIPVARGVQSVQCIGAWFQPYICIMQKFFQILGKPYFSLYVGEPDESKV